MERFVVVNLMENDRSGKLLDRFFIIYLQKKGNKELFIC